MRTLLYPPDVPYPTRYIIDPVAFFLALVGGPLLFTFLSFWFLFIPVFALVLGAPAYLIIGTPLLLWHLRHHHGDPDDLAWLAFKAIALGLFGVMALAALTQNGDLFGAGMVFGGFAAIFGPAWAYFFGRVYARLRRDFFAKPRPF